MEVRLTERQCARRDKIAAERAAKKAVTAERAAAKGRQLRAQAKLGRFTPVTSKNYNGPGILSWSGAKSLYDNMYQVTGQPIGAEDGRAKMGVTLTFAESTEPNQSMGLFDAKTSTYIPNRDDYTPSPGCSERDLCAFAYKYGGDVTVLKASPSALKRITKYYGSAKEVPPASFYVNVDWLEGIDMVALRKEWTPSASSVYSPFDTMPTQRPRVKKRTAGGHKWVRNTKLTLPAGLQWKFPTDNAFMEAMERDPSWVVKNGEGTVVAFKERDGIPIPALMTNGRGVGRNVAWQNARWRTMGAKGFAQNPDYAQGRARIYPVPSSRLIEQNF